MIQDKVRMQVNYINNALEYLVAAANEFDRASAVAVTGEDRDEMKIAGIEIDMVIGKRTVNVQQLIEKHFPKVDYK